MFRRADFLSFDALLFHMKPESHYTKSEGQRSVVSSESAKLALDLAFEITRQIQEAK